MNPRIKAFLIHLTGSVILAILALLIVFCIWYPSPLQIAMGVSKIFLMMLGIDVIVGPMLTLLVYKVGKKSLKFDLATIVIIQVAVFSYGFHTIAIGRPAWLVFNVDRFTLVRATDIDQRKINQAKPEYQTAPWFGPEWVSAHIPKDPDLRKEVLFESVQGGYDIQQRPILYDTVASQRPAIQIKAQSISTLNQFNTTQQIKKISSKWPTATVWLPLKAPSQDMVVLLNKNDDVVSVVNLRPWQ
jgi:hypothetical protein